MMLLSERGRIGATAETQVFRRSQGKRKVLPCQERMPIEPGLAAVPTLDRWWEEYVLAQAVEGIGKSGRTDATLQRPDDAEREIDRRLDAGPIRNGRKEQV